MAATADLLDYVLADSGTHVRQHVVQVSQRARGAGAAGDSCRGQKCWREPEVHSTMHHEWQSRAACKWLVEGQFQWTDTLG